VDQRWDVEDGRKSLVKSGTEGLDGTGEEDLITCVVSNRLTITLTLEKKQDEKKHCPGDQLATSDVMMGHHSKLTGNGKTYMRRGGRLTKGGGLCFTSVVRESASCNPRVQGSKDKKIRNWPTCRKTNAAACGSEEWALKRLRQKKEKRD